MWDSFDRATFRLWDITSVCVCVSVCAHATAVTVSVLYLHSFLSPSLAHLLSVQVQQYFGVLSAPLTLCLAFYVHLIPSSLPPHIGSSGGAPITLYHTLEPHPQTGQLYTPLVSINYLYPHYT